MRLSAGAVKKRLLTNSVVAPAEEDDTALFGPGAALEAKEGSGETAAKPPEGKNEERQFKLTMYRVDKATLQVETLTRAYATLAAQDAAKRFLAKEGYTSTPPNPQSLQAMREKAKQLTQKKENAAKNACPFRATWSENGVTSSRCFASAKELTAFQQSRQKQAAAKTAKKAPTAPNQNGALQENAIQPVKLN